ncbi:MAG: type II toxin-antitoxin system RelE/ParE family toxin [Bacteroidetes bacterium]|nr:type II toxin-antitoxin system RelE/ParE family toxin [Bacteroidota bacterium]MBU1373232.1 type II toxin-antitoxin system RelE/ParE family toxin [Bacteroidota bacterium]MBU1486304.1 type II toxin-antitoxin system RelE/ParE family toxin [Bacteroidota bacterium]MBU1761285.1 type II toxin-antitoxin system RelE/ParE family toxin [Bacteroidota bacterium]MBU2047282.1 type II toxin-antitoxin system RelE/ParE family toxin [Bacteroidota bacterium]
MVDELIWSPESEEDFLNILNYLISDWNVKIASDFVKDIEYHIEKIHNNPQSYPIIYKQEQVRKCVVTKHNSLVYNLLDNKIFILRVFDTRQNPNKLKFPKQ